MIVYTLHQGLFTAVGLASFVALFVFGATLAAGSRLIVQILRSRPRPRAHPIDSLPLLPPTAADAFASAGFRQRRVRFFVLFALGILLLPALEILEEGLDEATVLWPREQATVDALIIDETFNQPNRAFVTYTYTAGDDTFDGDFLVDYNSAQEHSAVASRYAPGSTFPVWVDPYDRDDSFPDPPLLGEDVTPAFVGGIMTPLVTILLGTLAVSIPWLLRRRRRRESLPPAAGRAVAADLDNLALFQGERLVWKPRFTGSEPGIRHVLQPAKGEAVLGVLDYDPQADRIEAVLDEAYTLTPQAVEKTALVHFYAAAEFRAASWVVWQGADRIATVARERALAGQHTTLAIEGGPTYVLRGHRGFREDHPGETLLIYGRRKPPRNPDRPADGMTGPFRRPLATFHSHVPDRHRSLLALAVFLAAGWRQDLDLADFKQAFEEEIEGETTG